MTVVSLLAVSAIGVLNSKWADVDTVTVVGNERTSADGVVTAAAIVTGTPLLDVDLNAAEQGIETLPWIRKAELERRWNGEIVIRITERQPVLALPVEPDTTAALTTPGQAANRFVVIDQLGQQLEVVDAQPAQFIPVNGIAASGNPGESAPSETGLVLTVVQSLPPRLTGTVTALTMTDNHLFLELSDGVSVNLGDDTLLGEKIQALETVLARVDLSCVTLIDLRVPSAAAVQRAESAEGACI